MVHRLKKSITSAVLVVQKFKILYLLFYTIYIHIYTIDKIEIMNIFHGGNPSRSFSLSATCMYSAEFVISNIRYYQLSDPNIIPNNPRPHTFS